MTDRVYSTWELPTYQVLGKNLLVHWDSREEQVETQEGELETQYSSMEVVVPMSATKDEFIAAIDAVGGPSEELADGWNRHADSNLSLDAKRKKATLSRMNFMLGLEDMGYYDTIKGLMESNEVDKRMKMMWESASVFERTNPYLLAMAENIGFSESDMDLLFGIK